MPSVPDRLIDQNLRIDQRRLEVQMCINESGSHILSFEVDLFFSRKIADADNNAIGDGDIALLHTVGEYVDDLCIFQDEIRRNEFSRRAGTGDVFIEFHMRAPFSL